MTDQNNKNASPSAPPIGTISSGLKDPGAQPAMTRTGDGTTVVDVVRTPGLYDDVTDSEYDSDDEGRSVWKDPCNAFHFMVCAIFPPYLAVWVGVCIKEKIDKRIDAAEERELEERRQNEREGLGKKTKLQIKQEAEFMKIFKKNPKLAEKRREIRENKEAAKAKKKADHIQFMTELRAGRLIEKNERHARRAAEVAAMVARGEDPPKNYKK